MMRLEPQTDIQSCALRLRSVLDYLNPAERRVADYILENQQDVLNSTINELAAKSGSSYATITRLIGKIGFKGYKEMKKSLYSDALQEKNWNTLDAITFSQGTSTEDVCRSVHSLCMEVLSSSYSLTNPEILDQAARKIISARSLCIIGTGSSGISARYAYGHFMRIGLNCFCDDDGTYVKIKSSLLEKDDVLFAISSSGRTADILECAKIAKQNGASVIALSDYAISQLSQLADINLYTTPRNVSQFLDIDMPLLQGQFYLLDVLYMVCCVKMGQRSSELFARTKVATDSDKVR